MINHKSPEISPCLKAILFAPILSLDVNRIPKYKGLPLKIKLILYLLYQLVH